MTETNTTANVETSVEESYDYQNATPLTFDDLLKDPEYQREFDKKMEKGFAKRLETEKTKWKEAAEKERSEAERLASMSAEEKHQHELEVITKERDELKAEKNAYDLKEAATRTAVAKGLDPSLLNLLDYRHETAESIKDKIEEISFTFKKAVERGINDKLRQVAPQQRMESHKSAEEEYLDAKYGKNPYYNK